MARLRPPPALSPPQLDELAGWLQTTVGVVQSTVGSAEFLERAAEALVQIVGLDSGRVLLLEGDHWNVATRIRSHWNAVRMIPMCVAPICACSGLSSVDAAVGRLM